MGSADLKPAPASIRRTEDRFEAAAGRSLFCRSWLATAPERQVVLVHGFGEHSGRYDELGAWLARRGCAVHAYDHLGHGRSPGRRNHVARFDEFLDDLGCFLARVEAQDASLPRFLVGHSMGGLVVAAFACARSPDVTAIALSSPALGRPPAVSEGRLRLARVLRRVAPRLALSSGLDVEGLSRDPEVWRRYVEDPLVDTRATLSLSVEMIDAAMRTAGQAGSCGRPLLLLHGADDPICSPAASESFFAGLPERPGNRLHLLTGLRHEIFNEPEREQVFEELFAWLLEREAEEKEAP